jgi:16S rRNA (adenine1518-N6/adenine1519-N6)-dimethyltransferase
MQPVKAKKHLGQHFLHDKKIAERIVNALPEEALENDLLEIGPGTGVLTDFILQKKTSGFVALDVDEESVVYLKQHYPKHAEQFLFADFLNYDLNKIVKGNFNVIGNFPYNISTQIMFRVLEYRNQVDYVVGMFQREVAKRIAEKPGSKEYGILSVLLQAYYNIEYLFTVNEGVFSPPPKVKSGVIRLKRNQTKQLTCNEELFFKVVKTAFNQRRKTLRNALRIMLTEELLTLEILNKRAEQLSVKDFEELTKTIEVNTNSK